MIPIPHVTRATPRINGRVIDDATGRPIAGALVEVVINEEGARSHSWGGGDERPGPTATTTVDGEFHVGTRLNFHLFWYANVSWQFHWPLGAYWNGQLRIKREGYSELTTPVSHDWDQEPSVREPDIRLVPVSTKE